MQIESQFAARNAVAHGAQQRQIGHLAAVVLGHETQHAGGAAFGLAHGHFGAVDEAARLVGVARPFGQAGAGAHVHPLPADHHPGPQLRQNQARLLQRLRGRQTAEQDAEFVAPEARQQVRRTDRLQQPLRDRTQQLVAKGVAHDLVDVLEAV